MKTRTQSHPRLNLQTRWILSAVAALTGGMQLAGAAGLTSWSAAGGNQNWSTAGNWTPGGGSAPPAAGDAVLFRATANSTAGTIDNIVDPGFTAVIGSLNLSNEVANTFHTTQIPAGNSLVVAGPFMVGPTLDYDEPPDQNPTTAAIFLRPRRAKAARRTPGKGFF